MTKINNNVISLFFPEQNRIDSIYEPFSIVKFLAAVNRHGSLALQVNRKYYFKLKHVLTLY